ncbi:energy transducer TonB [Massilia norwichensis]|uniref:Energy transducer TonB n=1 Tax=Massilia norwichensis TaxID=1442366 RepID=A0ABT2AAN1_9BURK|nr:energy transducer TonB [Massilia norwichensis]MCS0591132.1 energy transducer TonB [Massilia norwichensis]
MPRYAMLFAAALFAFSLNAGAQTDAPMTPPSGPQQNTCARPAYPVEALRNEWTGTTTIAFLIGPDGLVKDARLVKSSGHAVLDDAARNALSRCQFKPAMLDGKPVTAWQPVQYVWSL